MKRHTVEVQHVGPGQVRLLLDTELIIRAALLLPAMFALFAFWLGFGLVLLAFVLGRP